MEKLEKEGWKETPEGWVNSNAPFTPPVPKDTAMMIEKIIAEWEAMDSDEQQEKCERIAREHDG